MEKEVYEKTKEFDEFSNKAFHMDLPTLKNEIEFLDKCIFFTLRAAKLETPGGDQTMHNQADRLFSQRSFMVIVMNGKKPKVKKRAPKRKKR